MSKMKYGALIIEDEPLAAERLTRVLGEVASEVEVRKSLGTVQESVAFFQDGDVEIDLVFMDIHLADGNAFEIFKHAAVSKPIIFILAVIIWILVISFVVIIIVQDNPIL